MSPELSWTDALSTYCYPVDLRCFGGRDRFGPGWFEGKVAGDRQETILFENRFRAHAQSHLEAWYEVVFWKMASQRGRADRKTDDIIGSVRQKGLKAELLWDRCCRYVSQETEEAFRKFQRLLFSSRAIAIAYTFPAFACPEKFPMLDTRIARYVASEGKRLDFPDTPKIENTLRRYRRSSNGVLTFSDWPFVEAWMRWCQEVAQKLNAHSTDASKVEWRTRDVEMAVFRAWGERRERTAQLQGPRFSLPVP